MSYLSVGPIGPVAHSVAKVLSKEGFSPAASRGFSVAGPVAVGSMLRIGFDRLHRLLGKVVVEERALLGVAGRVNLKPFEVLMKHGVLEVEKLSESRDPVYHKLLVDHGLLEHESRNIMLGLKHYTLAAFGDPLAELIASKVIGRGLKLATPDGVLYLASLTGLVAREEYAALEKDLRSGGVWSLPVEWFDRARETIPARVSLGIWHEHS